MNNVLFVAILADAPISSDDIVSKLFPNIWAFITQLLAFIVMVVIVIYFGYKPVHKFLEKRRNYVKDNLESAEKQNRDASIATEQAHKNLANSKKEASDIVMAAKKQAEEDKVAYSNQLKDELKLKRIEAEKDIEMERQQALNEAKGQMVDIALAASSSLLGKKVDSEADKKYVAQFVDDMTKDSKKENATK